MHNYGFKKKRFSKNHIFYHEKFKMEKSNDLFYVDFKNLHVLQEKKELQIQLLQKIRNRENKK